ncbi:hypothetical protein ACFXKW_31885 [Streptomyces sp. NPDC059193]|uniref:hypothetical protein n=1 Tax=Streptomyces sp. NPDC059193 TaxID=3346763 RepID=UPI0036C14373
MSAQDARAQRLARLAAQVDWSKVIDPYTREQYGPEVMAGLWATDRITADRTCTNLHCAANGDGSSVRVAAAEILPLLVEAALDPEVTVRFEILRTIADIAGTGNTAPTAKVDRILEGKWRPTVDATWPAAWEQAAEGLLPLLDDGDDIIRAGAVGALAQSAAHADSLITCFRTRFDNEPDLWLAGRLVLGVGELARHATQRREEALAWLRHRMTVGGKGAEPDIDQEIDAWIAWDEEICHDVRLQAVEALCSALPEHSDPLYAPVTIDALLASSTATVYPPVQYYVPQVDVITEADQRLGADLPGRLALRPRAAAPRRHHRARGRPQDRGVPGLPLALRRTRTPPSCGRVRGRRTSGAPRPRSAGACHVRSAARPWAGLVATDLTAAGEPHELGREHAILRLSRMGDDRCVPLLTELLAARGNFASSPTGSPDRG